MAVGNVSSPRIAPSTTQRAQPTKEEQFQEVMKDGPKGAVGQAKDYWDDVAKQPGAKGVAGTVMSGLLTLSGLPDVEKSAAELGARVGVGDSAGNIAKAGGKLVVDSALAATNLATGAGALRSGAVAVGAKGVKAAAAGKALNATVVRHYTSAEKAAKIMKSGEIWASKAGNAGLDKVYLLAEESGKGGMNSLRRFNIGYGKAAETAKAIEIDLAKLPPDVRARITESAAQGPLKLEHFVTHEGKLDFNQFKDAVKVLDTEQMKVTMDQMGKAGASLAKFGSTVESARRTTNDVIIRP